MDRQQGFCRKNCRVLICGVFYVKSSCYFAEKQLKLIEYILELILTVLVRGCFGMFGMFVLLVYDYCPAGESGGICFAVIYKVLIK